jgi:hypothetical protein
VGTKVCAARSIPERNLGKRGQLPWGGFDGIGYKAGKSDTPLGFISADMQFPIRCEPAARILRRSARAVAVGERDFDEARRRGNTVSVARPISPATTGVVPKAGS